MFSSWLLSWSISVEESSLRIIVLIFLCCWQASLNLGKRSEWGREASSGFVFPLVLAVCNILISIKLRIEAVFSICGITFWVVESLRTAIYRQSWLRPHASERREGLRDSHSSPELFCARKRKANLALQMSRTAISWLVLVWRILLDSGKVLMQ